MGKEYLTTEELCSWLKVSRNTINRWRKKGMPFIKTNRLVRFDKAKVEEWLEEQNRK